LQPCIFALCCVADQDLAAVESLYQEEKATYVEEAGRPFSWLDAFESDKCQEGIVRKQLTQDHLQYACTLLGLHPPAPLVFHERGGGDGDGADEGDADEGGRADEGDADEGDDGASADEGDDSDAENEPGATHAGVGQSAASEAPGPPGAPGTEAAAVPSQDAPRTVEVSCLSVYNQASALTGMVSVRTTRLHLLVPFSMLSWQL
jgi:hypothetical protein